MSDALPTTPPARAPDVESYGTLRPPDVTLEPFTPAELCEVIRCGEQGTDDCVALLAWSGRARGGVDLVIGNGLALLRQGDRLAQLGFRFEDYAREALGLANRTAQNLAHVAEQLWDRPLLREAVRSGKVLFCAAEVVLPVAKGAAEAEWVERASNETVRALKAAVREATKVAKNGSQDDPDSEAEWLRLRVSMRPEEREVVDEALAVADELMPGASRAQRLEAIAQEFLGSFAGAAPAPEDVTLGRAFRAPRPLTPDDDARAEELERETDRWSHLPRIPPVPAPKVRFYGRTPVERLDRRLRQLAALRRRWDDHLAYSAATLRDARLVGLLGFSSLDQLCQDWLGLSPRTVTQRVRLEKELWLRPALRDAKAAGLSFEKLRLLSRLADCQVREWTGRASRMTCVALRRALEADEDRRMSARGRYAAPVTRSTALLLSAALDAVRKLSDTPISDGRCLAVLAQHFLDVWKPEVKAPKTPAQKARRRDVYCQVPGCSHRAMEAHHKKYRSHGGGDDLGNLIGLCSYHHHRCIHAGHLRVVEKDGVVRWWLKGKPFTAIASPELRAG